MTDPRIAALAEARHAASHYPHRDHSLAECPVPDVVSDYMEDAAAILAALSPEWTLIRVDDLWNACDCPYHGQEDAYRKVLANHQPYCNLAQEPLHGILAAALG